ncbi:hypothetical protein [Kitasatospora sp. NPDC004272]
MFRNALPVLAAGILTAATALGAAAPASADARPQDAGHRGLVWTYQADQHIIQIHDKTLFAAELCAGPNVSTLCTRVVLQCANQTRDVNVAWMNLVDKKGNPKCPRGARTAGSDLDTAMRAVAAYWV